MNKKSFFVKPDDTVPSRIPSDLIYRLEVDDINAPAAFATTLTPESEVTEAFGYASALFTYYQANDDVLKDCYIKLISNSRGKEFLCSTIQLCLFEKSFREIDISPEIVERYNRVANNYQKQLKFNNEQYSDEQTINKTK